MRPGRLQEKHRPLLAMPLGASWPSLAWQDSFASALAAREAAGEQSASVLVAVRARPPSAAEADEPRAFVAVAAEDGSGVVHPEVPALMRAGLDVGSGDVPLAPSRRGSGT